jgi:choline dehydrogenase-like flavoprotein
LQEAQRSSYSDRLKIVTHALVQRVLVDSSMKAYGVQYVRNDRSYTVRARKEIILSAGTIGTPQILMLSGIGPKEHLNALGVILGSTTHSNSIQMSSLAPE